MGQRRKRDGSILVVDDEASLRETFAFFLAREGYDPILTAANFEEALSIISTRSVDLTISDIVLDKSSGIDLLKYARKNGIDCPFIIITGYPDVDTAAESLRFGAFDYIVKPVDKDDLLRSVRLALQQRRLEIERRRAEEERERYRVFLDTVFKSASDAIIIVDETLTVCKINEAARVLLGGLLPGLDVGLRLGDEINGSEFSSLRPDLLRLLDTGEAVREHRFECKTADDTLKVLSICASPLRAGDNRHQGAVIVIRDMSPPAGHSRAARSSFHRFVGGSEAMQTVYTLIENVGRVDTTVLITGESGTGKELAAEALHRESSRRNRPLIKVDCTAIPENLLESELFGHRKGSFTGADKDRKGLLLQADGSTLFLDEIGEISAMTQLRLLRFLQERTFYPVGSDTPIVVDTRVITATNVDLRDKVEAGSFREDLYFRLKVIDIALPPLRRRSGDVDLLAAHFARRYGEAIGKPVHGISDNAMAALRAYRWPGNVRELEHLIERAVVLCQGPTITTRELPRELFEADDPQPEAAETASAAAGAAPLPVPPEEPADGAERNRESSRILAVLARCGGNKAKAARLLGIDRSTLYRRIRELDIDLSVIALE